MVIKLAFCAARKLVTAMRSMSFSNPINVGTTLAKAADPYKQPDPFSMQTFVKRPNGGFFALAA
jgi:hypothetical protein